MGISDPPACASGFPCTYTQHGVIHSVALVCVERLDDMSVILLPPSGLHRHV